MSLPDAGRRSPVYVGTGSVRDFAFSFRIFAADQVTVQRLKEGEAVPSAVPPDEYAVSFAEDGGTVSFITPPAKSDMLVILSNVPYTQDLGLNDFGAFNPSDLTQAWDKNTALIQQIKDKVDKAVTIPDIPEQTPQEFAEEIMQASSDAAAAADRAEASAQEAADKAEEVKTYSYDIPRVTDSLDKLAAGPDGLYALTGMGDKGDPGEDISNRVVKVPESTALRALGDRFADVVNVMDFGAKGDGATDDTAAIQAAVVYAAGIGKACYIPSGKYLTSSDIYLPSHIRVFGAGRSVTRINLSTSADLLVDGFCNEKRFKAKYQSEPQTEYDEDIHISELTVHMCGWDRAAQGSDTYGGCGVKLAGVKNATVSNVTVVEPIMHGFDCATFELANNYNVGHFNYASVLGGCDSILFAGTTTVNPVTDDGITTHFATNVAVDGHTSIFNRAGVTVKNNQAGVEFDGGSQNCRAVNCYVNGFAKGFTALGHYTEPPARNICFDDCTTESVYCSLHFWCVPTEIPLAERAEKTCARNVIARNITVRNPLYNTTEETKRIRPFRVEGYANVLIDGVQVEGLDSRDTKTSVQCVIAGYYGVYKNLFFNNYCATPETPEYYGVVTTQQSDTLSALHNSIENVFFDTVAGYTYAIYDASGGVDSFRNCHAHTQVGLTKGVKTLNPNAVLLDVDIAGAGNQIQIISASESPSYREASRDLSARPFDAAQNLRSSFMGRKQPHITLGASYVSNGGSIGYPDGTQFFVGNWNEDTKEFTTRMLLSAENNLAPGGNATQALGSSALMWSELFAATGTINTSDERSKANVSNADEALMRAWGKVNFRVFQFKDAVEKKGSEARLHVGVIAQQVIEAFASEGLDAARYGLLCYDKWGDEYEDIEITDADGAKRVERRKVLDAGDRYGIRYEEALALEAAYQRWELEKIKKRLILVGV